MKRALCSCISHRFQLDWPIARWSTHGNSPCLDPLRAGCAWYLHLPPSSSSSAGVYPFQQAVWATGVAHLTQPAVAGKGRMLPLAQPVRVPCLCAAAGDPTHQDFPFEHCLIASVICISDNAVHITYITRVYCISLKLGAQTRFDTLRQQDSACFVTHVQHAHSVQRFLPSVGKCCERLKDCTIASQAKWQAASNLLRK